MFFSVFKKNIKSFGYAIKGILHLFSSQKNMRIHFVIAVAVILSGFYFKITAADWSLVVICITLVFFAEAINTSIEYLTDLAHPDFHPLAGKIKDISAGAVLLAALGAAVVGLIIFSKYLTDIVENLRF